MTTAALYCVYDDSLWLDYSCRSIYEAVDAIYFFVSDKPWKGPFKDKTSTLEAIRALPDPAGKIEIIEGHWEAEHEQRNLSLGYAQYHGHDYGLVIDADEVYETQNLQNALVHARSRPEVDVWHIRCATYWKSLRYRIDPPEPYDPPTLIRLGSCGFIKARNTATDKNALMPPEIATYHHMSYARPDDDLRRKISTFDHADLVLEHWYEDVWKRWDRSPGMQNLHPVNPPQYGRAVEQNPMLIPTILLPVWQKGGLP